MKNLKLLALLGIAVIAGTLAGCGSNDNDGDFIIEDITGQNDAVINYNDSLVDLASQCLISEDAIWNTYNDSNSSAEDITNAINNTISECTKAGKEISKLGDWEGDSSLKDGVLNIIEKEINYYSKFNELLPYLEKGELTEEENEAYNKIYSELEALDKELSDANDGLTPIQETFAKNHGFELEEEVSAEEVDAIDTTVEEAE